MPKRPRPDSEPEASTQPQRPHKQPRATPPEFPGPYKAKPAPAKSWVVGHRQTHKIVKLAPTKPFSTIPPGRSATASRRAQHLNHFLVSRKTTLGTYLRRCKAVILESNTKTLYFSAMGAAIPLLLQVTASLPQVLPYDRSRIAIEVKTGTTRVHDELVPNDEDEDITQRTRDKAALHVVVRVDGGDPETGTHTARKRRKHKKTKEADADAEEEEEDDSDHMEE